MNEKHMYATTATPCLLLTILLLLLLLFIITQILSCVCPEKNLFINLTHTYINQTNAKKVIQLFLIICYLATITTTTTTN